MSDWKPQDEGDIHPKCGTAVVRKPGMFAFRGWVGHGLVCVPCNALWCDPTHGPTIFDVAERMAKEPPSPGNDG